MSDYTTGACWTGTLGDTGRPEPNGPRATGQYAQAKQEYYSNPLLNELHSRRRVLEANRDQTAIDLNVIYQLLRVLGQ